MSPGEADSEGGGRLDVLDGLRALAIFMVFYAHVSCFLPPDLGTKFQVFGGHYAGRFLMNGLIGVRLFFCLSGFLITRQLLPLENFARAERRERTRFVGRYLKKRFFRLAPAYYLAMTVILVIIMVENWARHEGHIHSWLRDYACHLLFLQDYCGLNINPVFWSLAAEAKFYLLAPFIVMLLLRLRPGLRYGVLGMALLGVLAIRVTIVTIHPPVNLDDYFNRLWVPFYSALDCLLAGMLCCFIWADRKLGAAIRIRGVADVMFAGGVLLLLFLTAGVVSPNAANRAGLTPFTETAYFSLTAVAFSLMMLGLLGGCAGHRVFKNRGLRGLALISYSVYLIHSSFGVTAWRIAIMWLGAGAPQTTLWLAAFFILSFLSLPLAVLSYYLVERPFIDWSHRRIPASEEATIMRGW
jgi:peptidoglycan/LPS O-acetylase OafA/YrhL